VLSGQIASVARHGFALVSEDPDRPFAFEEFVAIASAVRHSGRCEVWTEHLPYGMWWQELRPSIELRIGRAPGSAVSPAGVWADADRWIDADDDDYAAVVAPYRSVPWLDVDRPVADRGV
jgi:hypothetical protein